jgi:hypothetical protein
VGVSVERGDDPINVETVQLPIMTTGSTAPRQLDSPIRTRSDGVRVRRHRVASVVPENERGMLIFVGSLIAVGTFAVFLTMGLGALTPARAREDTRVPPGHTATSTNPAAASTPADPYGPNPTGSHRDLVATHRPSPSPSPWSSPSPLGAADINGYCQATGDRRARLLDSGWMCVRGGESSVAFTPAQVCRWQYGSDAQASVADLADPSTWQCYR